MDGCITALVKVAVAIGVDLLLAQLALLELGSFHIIAGFWQVLAAVVILESIVSVAAGGAIDARIKRLCTTWAAHT